MFIITELELELKKHFYTYHKGAKVTPDDLDKLMNFAAVKKDHYMMELIHDIRCPQIFTEYQTSLAKTLHTYKLDNSKKIKEALSKEALEVCNILKHKGTSCVCGGVLRDTLLDKTTKDFDFVTNISYDNLSKIFKDAGYKVNTHGKQFLVLEVTKDGHSFEIANYRKDGTYTDGRRPQEVKIGSIFDDANRRDFTINALYWNIEDEELLDPLGRGIRDIKDNLLRFVGKPQERLHEDYLRGWRYLRFLKTKGLKPHPASYRAVKEHWTQVYNFTDPQRVLQEMQKIIGF